jgi:formate dehydrogenase maturation protein FdhE
MKNFTLQLEKELPMACNPMICPDCSYPPNFSIVELPRDSNGLLRYEIDCRDCGDVWVEVDDEQGDNEPLL